MNNSIVVVSMSVEARKGVPVDQVVRDALQLSIENGVPINLKFNDRWVEIDADSAFQKAMRELQE